MSRLQPFQLPQWLEGNAEHAKHTLGGSAAPPPSLDDIVALSSDPAKTKEAFQFSSLKLQAYSAQGSLALRETIAEMYKDILPEHVVTTTATTGANLTVFHSLLQTGDHVICQYPTYPQLYGLPKSFKCELSYWRLDPENKWRPDLEGLRKLIKPETKMLIVNNPSNPTGVHFDEDTQRKILDIAREHDLIVFADEIFRPLFHGPENFVTSFVEHEYTKVLSTASMSKAWGMPGVRTGWIICRDDSIMESLLNAREYTLQATSVIDEAIATETLSSRCSGAIVQRNLDNAQKGLQVLGAFVEKNKDVCSWIPPTGGATAFVKFVDQNGQAEDDNELCRLLLDQQGLLLSPGSLGFSDDKAQKDFRGYVRIQITLAPSYLQQGLDMLDAFLEQRRKGSGEGNVNGAAHSLPSHSKTNGHV